MRGSKAKLLRRLAKEDRECREYQEVRSPQQRKHPFPSTIIANEERFFYQTLKGRRSLKGI